MNSQSNSLATATHNLPHGSMLVFGVRGTLGAPLATDVMSSSTLVAAAPGVADDLNGASAFEDQVFLCLVLLAVGCLTLLGVGIGAMKLRNNTNGTEAGVTAALV